MGVVEVSNRSTWNVFLKTTNLKTRVSPTHKFSWHKETINSIKQHSYWFLALLLISLHDGWRPFHALYELKMGKSTYTACAAILVGHVHCKLRERAILGGTVGLCTCSTNQKARLRSRDHSTGSRYQCKLRSPQWWTMKLIRPFYPTYPSGIRIPR